MVVPVDIVRLEWDAARIAHCRLSAWEAGEHESTSATSSIGFAFTTQCGAIVEIDGKAREKDVVAGRLVLTGAEPVSWLRVREPSELIEIAASPELRQSVAIELGVTQWAGLTELDVPADRGAWAIAARFRSAMRAGAPLTDLERDAMVRLLYAKVLRSVFGGALQVNGDGALDIARLTRVTDYVEANLGSPLSLEYISDVAALSPFHFLRSFRAAVGVSPHRYVTMRRMERAKDLLIAGDSLAEIAAKAGYSSRSWFAAAFRQHFGFGPADVPVRGASRWLAR